MAHVRSTRDIVRRWCPFRARGTFTVVEVALAAVPACALNGSALMRFERASDRRASMSWEVGTYDCSAQADEVGEAAQTAAPAKTASRGRLWARYG